MPQASPWHLQDPTSSTKPPLPPQLPPSASTSGPAPLCRMFTSGLANRSPELAPCPRLPALRPTRRDPSGLGERAAATWKYLVLRPKEFLLGKPDQTIRAAGWRCGDQEKRTMGKKQRKSGINHCRVEEGGTLLGS